MSNNSRRLLSLLEVLKKNTDSTHHLKENELKALLNGEDISINNRKTIYSDISTLLDYGYEINYDTFTKGYWLEEAPFRLSEVKLLLDSIDSLNNIDSKAKEQLNTKILSFISSYEAEILKDNQLTINNQTTVTASKKETYLDKLETILKALTEHKVISFKYAEKEIEAYPYFINYSNERYYLYVMFADSDNSYSYRMDRMSSITLKEETYDYSYKNLEKIKQKIKTSYDNFIKDEPEIIILETDDYKAIEKRLKDDFPAHYLDNKGNIVIEYSPTEIFYSKIVSYSNRLRIISPEAVAVNFKEYLSSIIRQY